MSEEMTGNQLHNHLRGCNRGEYIGECKFETQSSCPALSEEWGWLSGELQKLDRVTRELGMKRKQIADLQGGIERSAHERIVESKNAMIEELGDAIDGIVFAFSRDSIRAGITGELFAETRALLFGAGELRGVGIRGNQSRRAKRSEGFAAAWKKLATKQRNQMRAYQASLDEVRAILFSAPSKICSSYGVQNCHVCEDGRCGDNLSSMKKAIELALSFLPEDSADQSPRLGKIEEALRSAVGSFGKPRESLIGNAREEIGRIIEEATREPAREALEGSLGRLKGLGDRLHRRHEVKPREGAAEPEAKEPEPEALPPSAFMAISTLARGFGGNQDENGVATGVKCDGCGGDVVFHFEESGVARTFAVEMQTLRAKRVALLCSACHERATTPPSIESEATRFDGKPSGRDEPGKPIGPSCPTCGQEFWFVFPDRSAREMFIRSHRESGPLQCEQCVKKHGERKV